MCSFDVKSLFTNIPLHETVDIICSYVSKERLILPIPNETLRKLLLLCTENMKFSFEDQYYRQIDGVAMGSPLGPLLADIFMAHIENKVEETIESSLLYQRYVDDILVLGSSSGHLHELFEKLNSVHSNISLTYEDEADDKLPFLDVLMKRNTEGFISRSVHRKSTWTGQYIHFQSFCPLNYKKGLVRTLFNRARRVCTEDTLTNELKFLRSILLENGYPANFIERFQRCRERKMSVPLAEKKRVFIELPYKGEEIHTIICERLNSAINRAYNAAKLVIINRTKSLPVSPKRRSAVDTVTSHIIYEWQCSCGHSYIGRTNRQLSTRMSEHIPKWLANQISHPDYVIGTEGRHPASSVAKHLIETGHRVNIANSFKIIFHTPKPQLLRFAEALAIKRKNPELCVQKQFVITLRLPW
jgi:hypothetical protein